MADNSTGADAQASGRLRGAFQGILRGALANLDYLALYQARVESQKGQTLELSPLDKRIPDLDEVPIWHGLPGVEVTVQKGAIVLLGFRDGDPASPFAMLWNAESLTDLKLTAGGKVTIEASGPVEVKSGGDVKVTAKGSAAVEAQGSATVKAALDVSVEAQTVHLGGSAAVLPVARMTDNVQAGPYAGTIVKGSSSVFGA